MGLQKNVLWITVLHCLCRTETQAVTHHCSLLHNYMPKAEQAHSLLEFFVPLSKGGVSSIFDIQLASKDSHIPPGEAKHQHFYHSAVLPFLLHQLIASYRAENTQER